jgi:glucose dehydrogenase
MPCFDEKKLAVWKYQMEQMESILFTLGCRGIARGDAKKKRTKQFGLSPEEIAKRKRFNKKFVEKRNLGFKIDGYECDASECYQYHL